LGRKDEETERRRDWGRRNATDCNMYHSMLGMVTDAAIIVDPPREGEVINPMGWFESPGPFELEIGCGKGGFLLSRARAHSQVRLLGIEWANKYFRYCADRMVRWGLTNVRVMRTDARTFVIRHLPEGCLHALHLYHPDPWPKTRHHKRRLVQADFVQATARALQESGCWLVQSDHAEYFAQIKRLIDETSDLRAIPWELANRDPGQDWAGTNFEIKYGRDGREIFRLACVRVPARNSATE